MNTNLHTSPADEEQTRGFVILKKPKRPSDAHRNVNKANQCGAGLETRGMNCGIIADSGRFWPTNVHNISQKHLVLRFTCSSFRYEGSSARIWMRNTFSFRHFLLVLIIFSVSADTIYNNNKDNSDAVGRRSASWLMALIVYWMSGGPSQPTLLPATRGSALRVSSVYPGHAADHR